jgi:HEAT repeat protein
MGFYDLSKEARQKLVAKINRAIARDLEEDANGNLLNYFSDDDTYIRKAAYQAIGKLYRSNEALKPKVIPALTRLLSSEDHSVRQTAVNAAGEIGMFHFEVVRSFFDIGLFDAHHTVRNAVIGSLKKMGAKNPKLTLEWAKQYLHHDNKEIRREICHGIELRGRTHPQDILPMLRQLQHDTTSRVRNTLIHVLGQIAYKKGCLATVISDLNTWENQELIEKAIDEIVDVHDRYKSFAAMTQEEAIQFITNNFKNTA